MEDTKDCVLTSWSSRYYDEEEKNKKLQIEINALKTENNYLRHKLDELGQDKLYRCESSRVDFMTIGRGFRVNIRYCCEGHEKDFKDNNED